MTSLTKPWQPCCLLLATLIAGCDNPDSQDKSRSAAISDPQASLPRIVSAEIPNEIDLTGQVNNALADLAESLKIEVDEIEVADARTVQWPNSAVGCPEEGKGYAQVITPGVRIILKVNNKPYYYHGRMGRNAALCPAERATAPGFGQGEQFM